MYQTQHHIETAFDADYTRGPQHTGNVIPLHNPDPEVYGDLRQLAAMMPENYREIYSLRWGLASRPHSLAEIAEIVGSTPGTIRSRLEVCLWNCHRWGQHEDLPAIRRLLGADPDQWAARAWTHTARWDQITSRMAETRLLLAIAGMDVPRIQQTIGQHAVQVGALSTNPWGTSPTSSERAEQARPVIDRVLAHTIWPSTPQKPWEPDTFGAKRTLDTNWGQTKYGYLYSQKLNRMLSYDSALEHEMLLAAESDERVIAMIEQPLTVAAIFAGRQHLYTPDLTLRLTDGRTIVIEVKGPVRLGEWTHWMRWTALARYCELNGYGLYIGNCQTGSILDHYLASQNSPHREFVRALANEGAPTKSDNHVALQAEDQVEIALAVTAEMLAWEPGTRGGITNPTGIDLEKAHGFWHLIATHAHRLASPQAVAGQSITVATDPGIR